MGAHVHSYPGNSSTFRGPFYVQFQSIFHIYRALCGEVAHMKCMLNGSNTVRMGEKLMADIQVNLTDKHGNVIKKVSRGKVNCLGFL